MAFPINNVFESIVKEQNISDGGYVQMEWNSTDNSSLPVGTTCPIDSDYILFSTYHPSQQNAYGYHYSVKFLHRMAQLDYLPFYFNTKAVAGVDGSGNVTYEDVVLSTYPYTGNISTIANALAACLSDHGDLGTWTADTSGLSGSVTASINFDGATVKSAAQAIADAFGVDYQFIWSSRTIKFGSFDMNGDTPSYGQARTGANGITETVGTLVSATDGGIQYNTFRILGGTRNMSKKTIKGQNVQVTQRLMLDGDSILGGGSPKIMKDLVFDDIYPKMELWMYDVHERRCWLTDENGKKIIDSTETDPETGGTITHYKQYSKWYFKLAYWNGSGLVPYSFDTNLIIEGLPLSMEFQPNYADGALPQPLVGREFELTYFDALSPAREKEDDDIGDGYQPSHGEFRIIFKVDGGLILPSTSDDGIRPYGGNMDLKNNKVTLVNVAMDEVYKQAAKAELLEAGQAAMAAYTRDKSSFTYLTYGTPPSLGGNITMVRHDLITGEVQYTVGNYQNSKGLIGRLSDKIDTIGSTGGSATTGDGGNGTRGGGVSELSIPLLSRLMGSGSVIKDSLTILKELILGTNGHGIFIDNNGDASMTIGSLTVLGTTHLNEIDVNHIKHTGGMMIVTKANIIVDHVEHLDGGLDKLYFRRVDGNGQHIYNQFEVGDLALMMVFNEALDGSINRYFWREVSAIDDGSEEFGYIILLPSSVNHSEPREGDVVVQLGNTTKAERQGATVLGGSGPNGGFFAVYDGFTTWRDSAPQLNDYATAITYISPKRNKFNGDFISIAGHDLQAQLDALRASLLSVSQQSDKQLVIWYGDDDAPLPNSSDLTHYNDPAKDWHDADVEAGNTDQQQLHLEDVYYLRRNNTTRVGGRAWQWTYDSTLQKFLWVEITDVDTLAALEAADDAVATANEAKQKVENFGDDGIISAGTEKSELLIMWQDTVAEYVKLIEQAQDYDLDDAQNTSEGGTVIYTPYNAYVNRYHALALMLNGNSVESINSVESGNAVPAWLASLNVDVKLSDYSLTAANYRDTWKNYFDSRATLLKAIKVAARVKTEQAQTDATNALSKIGDMGNDDKLDPSEKLTVKREFLAAWRERAEIIARCMEGNDYINDTIKTSYIDPYVAAFRAVATYLNGSNGTWYTDPTTHETSDPAYSAANALDKIPLWLHANRKDAQGNDITETIDGDTWRGLWSAFYTARTALLTALSDDAKDRADAAQQAADDAQDTADKKKRVFSTSANELPPAPYDVGDLWVNAIWYTETTVNGVTSRTYKWTGDVLYCKTARTTNAARSINDWADAASGTTSKIQNLGDQILAEVNNRKSKTKSGLHLDSTSGSLYVEAYDSETDSWSRLATISLALEKNSSGNFTGKLNLTADNVVITSGLMTVISEGVSIDADQVDFTTGTFNIDSSHITFHANDISAAVGDAGFLLADDLIEAFVGDLSSIATDDKKAIQNRLGLVIRSDGSNGEFSFGTYSYANNAYTWQAGLSFKTENGNTKLLLNANNVEINANVIIRGESVRFGNGQYTVGDVIDGYIDDALDNFTVLAKHIGFAASDLNITAGDVNFNSGNYTINALSHIDFTGCEFGVKASNITFDTTIGAGNIDFTTGNFSIAASHISFTATDGKSLSNALGIVMSTGYASNNFGFGYYTYNSSTQQYDWNGVLNFAISTENNVRKVRLSLSTDTASIQADCINFTTGTFSIGADHINFTGKTVDLRSSTVNLNSSNLTLWARYIDFNSETITISAGEALTFTGGTASGETQGTISFIGARILMNAEQINFCSGSFAINNGTDDTFKVSSAGNVTVKGTINADAGYFKGELQGATGTFSGSLKSNDNKVLLTSTGVEGWGLSYTWRGFAVSNNGFTGGDLATIGARLDANGYDYGRIALVKRPTGTSSSSSADVNIVLSAGDGSIECTSLSCTTLRVTSLITSGIQLNAGTMLNRPLGNSLNEFTPSSSNNVVPIYYGNRVLVRGTYGTLYLPELASCRSALGIDDSTYFALDLIIIGAVNSSFTVYGYRSSTVGQNCPHLRNNDEYQDITGGIGMAQGDILHLVLLWDGTDYIAFIISHRD